MQFNLFLVPSILYTLDCTIFCVLFMLFTFWSLFIRHNPHLCCVTLSHKCSVSNIDDRICTFTVYSCWQRRRMRDLVAVWHLARNMTLKITCFTAISAGRNCRTARYNHLSSLKLSVYFAVSCLPFSHLI